MATILAGEVVTTTVHRHFQPLEMVRILRACCAGEIKTVEVFSTLQNQILDTLQKMSSFRHLTIFFFFAPYKISFWTPYKKWVLGTPYKISFWTTYKKLDFECLTKAPVLVAPTPAPYKTQQDFNTLQKCQNPWRLTKPVLKHLTKTRFHHHLQSRGFQYLIKKTVLMD